MLTLRLPQDIETRLSELARETGQTKSCHVRGALTTRVTSFYWLSFRVQFGRYTCIALENEMLALRLPHDIEIRLSELARETGRTKSYYAKEAILNYLDSIEDTYLAEKTVEKIRSGQERVFSTEEVEKLLNVEN